MGRPPLRKKGVFSKAEYQARYRAKCARNEKLMRAEAEAENRAFDFKVHGEALTGVTYQPEHRYGVFWEQLADLTACAAVMLCDLPWADEALPMYPVAGELAQRALIEGGSLFVFG
jgi:hypothetical protein